MEQPIISQLGDTKDGDATWHALSEWYDGDVAKAEAAEELRHKLQELTLTQGMDAMAYINKFLIYLCDLNKIPGEEFSASHGVSLFLRNIHNDDYKQEISILKTSNEHDIMHCVQAIRKRERKLIRVRAERRKLRQYPKCLREDDIMWLQAQKLRRIGDGTITGNVQLTAKGFIHLDNEQYRSLNDKSRKFIKQYNTQIRAGHNTPSVPLPPGVTLIPSTPQLVTVTPPPSHDPFTASPTSVPSTPSALTTHPKKRITFDIKAEEDETPSSSWLADPPSPWYIDPLPLPPDDSYLHSITSSITEATPHLSVTPRTLHSTTSSPASDILILDTGGGRLPTITRRAWFILDTHAKQSAISGYQNHGDPTICPIVNGIPKVHLSNRDVPILFIMNYATLIDGPDETESLCVPFAMMKHGVSLDITPPQFGGTSCGLRILDQFLPFQFDGEKLYYSISKPTEEDLNTLEAFELTSPLPSSHIRRLTKRSVPGKLPLSEWQKRLAFAPKETLHWTFEATTQHYMKLECKNHALPRDHYRSRVPGLRYPRQTETVATDTFFPSIRTYRGNTCSQFFKGKFLSHHLVNSKPTKIPVKIRAPSPHLVT